MSERERIGIDGVDDILHGGLIPGRRYLLSGEPGTGKTLFSLHFLQNEGNSDDGNLFINLGEAEEDIRQDAANFGFDLNNVKFLDLSPSAEFFVEDETYDVFAGQDDESESLAKEIVQEVEDLEPSRVVIDPLTHFRYLAPDDRQFREQTLSFLQYMSEQDATLLFTSQDTDISPDDDLQFMSDGVFHLGYAAMGRTFEVTKFRGSDFQSGRHSLRITDSGISVYPDLVPAEHHTEFTAEQISTGVPEMDQMLHGGLERGTITIISGSTGVGKTTAGAQFMKEAAGRGDRSVIYMLEESTSTFMHRAKAVNIPIEDMLERGTLAIEEIEAQTISGGELGNRIKNEVEENDTKIVMIDSIGGYQLALRGAEEELTNQIHNLGKYLQNMGVTTILIAEVPNITGEFVPTKHEVSYLSDNILFIRYLEYEGELQKAIGVLKKRASDFERTLREFEITEYGLRVGDPIRGLRGILTGTPEWVDEPKAGKTDDE